MRFFVTLFGHIHTKNARPVSLFQINEKRKQIKAANEMKCKTLHSCAPARLQSISSSTIVKSFFMLPIRAAYILPNDLRRYLSSTMAMAMAMATSMLTLTTIKLYIFQIVLIGMQFDGFFFV